jgi:hypothetical protein
MRYFRFTRLVSILVLLQLSQSLTAQVNLVTNGDFENLTGATLTVPPCPTFFNLQGWGISHGTPQLIVGGDGPVGPNYVRMWSQLQGAINKGEGITAKLNDTIPERAGLNLCFWYRTHYPPGFINVVLHNIPPTNPGGCGDPIPNFAPSQVVATIPFPATSVWTKVSIPFTANADYLYFSIYATSPIATDSTQTIHIDGVSLTYCEPNLIVDAYFPGSPSGVYIRQNYIQAGSFATPPGSITPVTVNPNISTTFRAKNFVLIQDAFISQPNPGSYFLAEIGPCDACYEDILDNSIGDRMGSPVIENYEEDIQTMSLVSAGKFSLSIIPNPASHTVFFSTNEGQSFSHVLVVDLGGRVVFEENALSQSRFEMNTEQLQEGVYIVSLRLDDGSFQSGRMIVLH